MVPSRAISPLSRRASLRWSSTSRPRKRSASPCLRRCYPLDPRIFMAQRGMATAHFLAGRYEEGSLWAKIAVQQNPDYVGAHRTLMACHAMAGRVEEARQAWAVARQIDPTQSISTIMNRLRLRWRPQDVQRYK